MVSVFRVLRPPVSVVLMAPVSVVLRPPASVVLRPPVSVVRVLRPPCECCQGPKAPL